MSNSPAAAAEDGSPTKVLDSDEKSHIPDDPLLDIDSFIENGDRNGDGVSEQKESSEPEEKGEEEEEGEEQEAKPTETEAVPAEAEAAAAAATPAVRSKKGLDLSAPERPDWLPENWSIELRVRSSGATAGSFDRYYIEPVKGRKFRSKKEVLHFLETGSKVKNKRQAAQTDNNTPSEDTGAPKQKKSRARAKAPVDFDFKNPPPKVSWSLTDPASDQWSPSIGEENVAESTKQEWAAAFDGVSHSKKKIKKKVT